MRWRVLRVSGVADVTEEIAGLHFHSFVEASGPAIEMRVEERCAVLCRQPDAMAAELFVADETDDTVGDGDDFRSLRCKDVDSFVNARAAVTWRMPAIVKRRRPDSYDRQAQRHPR